MARRKNAKSTWKTIELTANIEERDEKVAYRATQAEMHEMFDVKDRTLRGWAQLGLPTEKGPGGKTLYPLPDANIWGACYKAKVAEDRHGKGPAWLTVEQANHWHLAKQMEDWPEDFVIVPLDWDHPLRAAQLQRA